MKCLVFSDSHGYIANMKEAIRKNRDAEVIFFLGDGLSDIEYIAEECPDKMFFLVKGNCDFRSFAFGRKIEKTDSCTIGGKKIVFTHGDLYAAKRTYEELEALAEEKGADILLFGHTHRAYQNYIDVERKYKGRESERPKDARDSFYLFNPGSIGCEYRASFGIVTLTEGSVLFSHGKM